MECLACGEEQQVGYLRAPCGHEYCAACLRRLFTAVMTGEALFLPRCCGRAFVDPDGDDDANEAFMATFLAPGERARYRLRAVECTTRDRTYCHRDGCAAFVPPSRCADGVAACAACGARTCTACKAAAHATGDCPGDPALRQVLDLAREAGWQRCQWCGALVERIDGCMHIRYVRNLLGSA